jgi:serine/threonine protein kinase
VNTGIFSDIGIFVTLLLRTRREEERALTTESQVRRAETDFWDMLGYRLAHTPKKGEEFGDYTVDDVIYLPPFGLSDTTVYRVHQTSTGAGPMAMKLFCPGPDRPERDTEMECRVDAFLREIDSLRYLERLKVGGVPRVLDVIFFPQVNVYVYLMPVLDGPTLFEYQKQFWAGRADATLTPTYLLRIGQIGITLANTLDTLHDLDVVHRDVKPDNVVLDAQYGATLIDFGSVAVPSAATCLANDREMGRVAGTAGFMAPEVFRSDSLAHPAMDSFSLAATLRLCLTRTSPFIDPSRVPSTDPEQARLERMEANKRGQIFPTPFVPGLPDDLRLLLDRGLSLDPAARPAPADFARALHSIFLKNNYLPRRVWPRGSRAFSHRANDARIFTRGDPTTAAALRLSWEGKRAAAPCKCGILCQASYVLCLCRKSRSVD